MTIHDRRALKAEGARILANTPNQKRLVLLYAGASALLSLAAALISYLLNTGIAGTGGLAGIGLRSALDTAQQVLSMATSIALPFWGLGYTHTVLKMSRQQPVRETTLLEGFRRFGPGLRQMLLQSFLFMGLFMLCIYIAILILSMTPLAAPAYELLEPMVDQYMADPNWMPDEATYTAFIDALLPITICSSILGCVPLLFLFYRLRFSQMRLMDDPRCGARQALGDSFRITRKHCLALFKLDLSFWWFWLLSGMVTVISFGDVILSYLDVSLPLAPEAASWFFSILATVIQVALYVAFQNRVSITYALAYDTLLPKPDNSQLAIEN